MLIKKYFKYFIAVAIVIICILGVACEKSDDNLNPSAVPSASPETGTPQNYTITVKTEGGMPLPDIDVYVYTDSSMTEIVWAEKTDSDGKMQFSDSITGDAVVVLKKVPIGYSYEDTYKITSTEFVIALKTNIVEADIQSSSFKPGQIIPDFVFTDSENNTYKVSDILKEKKALVLNFWYAACKPCEMEFPYMDAAYSQFSDKLSLFAMNPVDTSNQVVQQFKTDNNLTIPMGVCSNQWEKALPITSYPTTVIIDRYGMISYIHNGYITSTEVFENIFAYYTSDEYIQKIITDIEEITPVEEELGTAGNPYEFGGVTEFEVEVPAGKTVYCDVYKVSGMIMEINSENISLKYQNEIYTPNNGKISFVVTSADTFTPVQLEITNTSNSDATCKFVFKSVEGTPENPYKFELGEFTTNTDAGDSQGKYYTYTATADGTIKITCKSVTSGISYEYVLYNLNSYAYNTMSTDGVEENGLMTVSVKVKKDDIIQISLAVLPDGTNNIAAGSFVSVAEFIEGNDDNNTEVKPEKITYKITVTDNKGNKLKNVNVSFIAGSDITKLTTNSNGEASIEFEEGDYSFKITIPDGYEADKTSFDVSKEKNQITVTINKKVIVENVTKNYVVRIIDVNGKPITGITVKFLQENVIKATKQTDNNGKATESLTSGEYTVSLEGIPEGMFYNNGMAVLSNEKTETTFVIAPKVSEEFTELYVGNANIITTNSVYVDLPSDEMNYFIFTPEASGLYRITLSNTYAQLSYWGGNEFYIANITETTDMNNNSFTLNVKEGNLGICCILGAVGDLGAILTVERTGDALLDISDIDYIIYTPSETPTKITINGSPKLTFVDITGATNDYKLYYNETDGYYHIGSENGPVAYVSFGESTPYISYKKLLETTGVKSFIYDKNGNLVKKEDYTNCIIDYVSCADETTGIYQLDQDLIYILSNHIDYMGWCDSSDAAYLFSSIDNVNDEISWMFLICYIQ